MSSAEKFKLPGNPFVMYVDDEAMLREVASMMIEDAGGRCLVAVDGKEAVKLFSEHAADIDFIYIDYSMPDMNGYETILELRKIREDIPICVVSGLAITPEIQKMQDDGKVHYLSKPFREADLIESFSKYSK